MARYDVTFKNEATFTIDADTRNEAIQIGLGRWDKSTPSIIAKEKKKVKKTVHYAELNYYKQDVLVDEDLDEDEIVDLWNADNIEILSEPELAESYSEIDYSSIWVE